MNFVWQKMGCVLGVTGAILFGNLGEADSFERIPTATGNYCKDQAIHFIKFRFGDEAKITEWFPHTGRPSGHGTMADVKVNFCDGFFSFKWFADSSTCKSAHYISVPRYLINIKGQRDCREFLPRAIRPTLEEIGVAKWQD